MKVLTLSDLHNEIYRTKKLPVPDIEMDPEVELLIFAGDIDTGVNGIRWAIEQSNRLGVPAVYVPGNHEFYGKNYHSTLRKMEEETEDSNVTLLSDKAVVINGVQVIGTTLWTDFELHSRDNREYSMREAGRIMNDYARIRMDVRGTYSRLKPLDTARLHSKAMKFMESVLDEEFDGQRLVVTHHAPSIESIEAHEKEALISAAYASDLSSTMRLYDIDLWVHGHTHHKVSYDAEGTWVYSNPRGYLGQDLPYSEEPITVPNKKQDNALKP